MGMRGEGEIQTLEVGTLTATKIPVVVLDHPTLKALSGFLGRPLDGIIGFTFFARYRTTIDYQARLMTFEPVNYKVRDLIKDLPDRLAGPKIAKRRVLAPAGVWGLTLGEPGRRRRRGRDPDRPPRHPRRGRRPQIRRRPHHPRRPLDRRGRRRLHRRLGRGGHRAGGSGRAAGRQGRTPDGPAGDRVLIRLVGPGLPTDD